MFYKYDLKCLSVFICQFAKYFLSYLAIFWVNNFKLEKIFIYIFIF